MLIRLGLALFLAQSAFNIYGATLPLYFASLGFDATLIGLLVGVTGVAELAGALAVGPSIDRFGAKRLLLAGAACYLMSSLAYTQLTSVPALVALRLIQGFGLAAVIPSTYSFVPNAVRRASQTVAFASLGAAGNVAMAICPPLGITLLLQLGSNTLFLTSASLALLGLLVVTTLPGLKPAQRPLSLTFRRGWLAPLLVAILSVVQWGVIQAFVPLEASAAGANPALLFTADAICVLASRVPAGWMADRYGPLRLALLGVVAMTFSPVLLLLPLDNSVLIGAGVLNGLGAGLTLPPMLAQLSLRSDDSTRGSALAYFSVAFAVGMIVGASGGGMLYSVLGFHGLLSIGAVLCACGVGVLLADMHALVVRVARPA